MSAINIERVGSQPRIVNLIEISMGHTFRLANPNDEHRHGIYIKTGCWAGGDTNIYYSVRLNDGHVFNWGPNQRVVAIDAHIQYGDSP